MPREQRHDYNRCMALAFVASCQMGPAGEVIQIQVENYSFDLRIDLLEPAATALEEDNPEPIAAHPVQPWRQRTRRRNK